LDVTISVKIDLAPLILSCGTLVCRGTPDGNQWFRIFMVNPTEKTYFLRLEKKYQNKKMYLDVPKSGKRHEPNAIFGILDTRYGMKNRFIRYLCILKLNIKYIAFPRFRELKMNFAHF